MTVSLVIAYKLRKCINLHNMTAIRKRLTWLEIFIQMIIITRLITSLVEIINPYNLQVVVMIMMAFSFTFSEILPFCLVVYGIYL